MGIDLTGRVCVVTGSAEGMGRGVAQGFARRGATVVATDLAPPDLPDVAWNAAWDVADPDRAPALAREVLDRFGRIDALVANAGIYPHQAWDQITLDDWRRVLDINLNGAWFGARAVAEPMTRAGYGKIVLVSSVEVMHAPAHHNHYVTAKAGLIGLTRSMARSLGPQGVRVNVVLPGAVLTDGELRQFPDQEQVARLLAERQCLPHRLLPEGIEPTFAFLCSADSDAITGQAICVDHGLMHY